MGSGMSSYGKTVKDIERNDPRLSELDLSNTVLSDNRVRGISESIHKNTYDAGTKRISRACSRFGTLEGSVDSKQLFFVVCCACMLPMQTRHMGKGLRMRVLQQAREGTGPRAR